MGTRARCAVLMAVGMTVVGCGGESTTTQTVTVASSRSGTASQLTKAEYVERVEQICKRARDAAPAAFGDELDAIDPSDSSPENRERMATAIARAGDFWERVADDLDAIEPAPEYRAAAETVSDKRHATTALFDRYASAFRRGDTEEIEILQGQQREVEAEVKAASETFGLRPCSAEER